jgi:alkanesulfonate monooxygenase SsuD/methylene tetrahydromethanopterin reductase-like flavin-dependent oxidoreductase (luciferase family)
MAAATARIRIGPMVTPLPRRRPWQVARQAVTLDQLSGGRLNLGVGIGGDWFGDYSRFGEPADDRTHGQQLDEALEVICGLWSGEPFSYQGAHYSVRETQFLPRPRQRPRIPIWVAGRWPGTKPFQRAARYDGVAALAREDGKDLTADEVRAIAAYIAGQRAAAEPIDIVLVGARLESKEYRSLAEAGATWYQVGFSWADSADHVREQIRRGPPMQGRP